ncbi:MAG: phosphoglucosamine mutase [Eubacteriales bacterium]|nr:phosphoglucosamine mutase [Eubacteriales bacterium]
MERMFGTDGVRGVAGTELDARLAYELGRAGAYVLSKSARRPRILVGRDTRISGSMLEAALTAGICAVGGDVLQVGVLPTPAVAWLTQHYEADAGVVISASHNPMEYNGIKFFDGRGFKLPDAVEDEIEAIVRSQGKDLPRATGEAVGRVAELDDDAAGAYVAHLAQLCDADLRGKKIVLDCANGAASAVAPALFRQLGAQVITVADAPDGVNINAGCGSTHLELLKKTVPAQGAQMGFAFDGDADRMLAVDETGCEVDGDCIMAICAVDMKKRGLLPHNTLVVTVMSNLGLKLAMEREGVALAQTKVGDRYVLECMREHGYGIGGEQSGHVILLASNTTGDGLSSALNLISAVTRTGKRLSEAAKIMTRLPQVLVNLKLDSNEKKLLWQSDGEITHAIAALDEKYAGRGRVLVRASGTEPLIRVMIEGEDEEQIGRDARELAALMQSRLG